jgi:electron transfer flavoprotein beta subunit
LHVVVVTKSTPDKEAKMTVNAAGVVTWGDAQMVINPWDEYSVTEAILLKEAYNVKATVLSVGPESNNDALKQALAMGVDAAVRVWDDSMDGQDSLGTASAIAAAIQKIGDVDLVIFGKEFMDIGTDAHIFEVGRKLGWPIVGSYLKILNVDFDGKTMTLDRLIEEGKQTVSTKLPAVIGVAQDINEPKYPSFMGIRKASKAEIPVWSSANLGLANVTTYVKTNSYANLPAWEGTVEIIEGGSEQEKAEKLVAKLLEDKLI